MKKLLAGIAADRRVLAVLLITAGLLLRLEYLRQFSCSPLFDLALGADVMEYDARANGILAGRFFARFPDIHGPLYSCFLALVYRISGHSVPAARIIQLFLNFAAWIAIYFLLLRRLRVPQTGALIFLALAMLYPVPFFYQAELVSESLMLPFTAAFLWLMALAGEKERRLRYVLLLTFAAGAVCGLLNLLHGMTFALSGAALCFLLYRRQGFRVMALLFGILLAVGTYTVINSRHYGKFTPVQANGAFNFWLGNNPESTGGCYLRPGAEWRRIHREAEKAAEESGRSVDRIWLERSASFWLDSPWQGMKLYCKKAWMIFHGRELITGADPWPIVAYTPLVKHGMELTSALFIAALYGMFALRKRFSKYKWFYLLFLAGWLIQFVTVTGGRYRMLMLPAVIFFAAAGIFSVNYRRCWWCVVLVVLLSGVPVHCSAPLRMQEAAERWSLYGEAAWRKGDIGRAKEQLTAASEYIDDPRRFDNLLGAIAMAERDYPSAARYFDRAIAAEPEGAESWMNRGNLLSLESKSWPEAEKCYRKALELDPELAAAYYNYGLFETKRRRQAHELFFRAVQLDPRLAGAWNMLGVGAMNSGRPVVAMEFFRTAAELVPDEIGFWYNLRAAAVRSGNRIVQGEAGAQIDRITAESKGNKR